MRGTLPERALEVLGDYLFELESRDQKRGSKDGVKRSCYTRAKDPAPLPLSYFDRQQQHLATAWEKEQLAAWEKNGRITADGYLRVGRDPLAPYTLADLARIMPQLNVFDRLAALIDLDGVVKGGFMASKEHENIREVVEHIADQRVVRRLQDGDTMLVIKDLIRAEVSAIFGEVLERVKEPTSTLKVGGRQLKCSKCHQPGHRSPTCGRQNRAMVAPVDDADSAVA